MKLNPDCIRDILLTIEAESDYNRGVTFKPEKSNFELLNRYSYNELFYHLRQCNQSSFFYKMTWDFDGRCDVTDLSPQGHQFLSDIRSDTNWNKTKDIAKSVGSFSLNTLKEISVNVVSEIIKSKF